MTARPTRAGAGKAVIRVTPETLPFDRFTAARDELCARAVILERGSRAVILSVEMTSLADDVVDALKAVAAARTGVPEDAVWICVTHTFSAPHIIARTMLEKASAEDRRRSGLLREALLDAAAEAAAAAKATLRDAVFRVGTGSCDVNMNRDIDSAEGWWIGRNPEGMSDKTLVVLRFDDLAGVPIAALYHYGVQASVMDGALEPDGGRLISGDLAGKASRVVEAALGGVALFLPGASGDQAPREKAKYLALDDRRRLVEKSDGGFELVTRLGGVLGAAVLDTADCLCAEAGRGDFRRFRITVSCPGQKRPDGFPRPCQNFVSVPEGEIETAVDFLRLGDELALVGVRPELNCVTAFEIRKGSPFQRTLVTQMVNGAQKYMADRESYARGSYEAMNSGFGPGAAERLRDDVTEALRREARGVE